MSVPGERVVVFGLGYVGLPLALALARNFAVTGFDISDARVTELKSGHDHTNEVAPEALSASSIALTSRTEDCAGADIYIVTVPTPVNGANEPDLSAVIGASETIGGLVEASSKPIIVYESTVYPGVTEGVCGPIIERVSGLVRGRDFYLGYSPERINPGDRDHTVEKITKVVAGENDEVTERLAGLYGAITTGGVFKARSIKTAEAAKVIENAQRDINIAFMNEITQIFSKMGLSIWDVLEAAGTKWNFLKFHPGLVGGHCIGVDPYYLSYRAQQLGIEPHVILAGRSINDGMGQWVADRIHETRGGAGTALVMGLTFKENVPDLRNSKVMDLVHRLRELGHVVTIHDPLADPTEALAEYGVELDCEGLSGKYDTVVVAVPHAAYAKVDDEQLRALVTDGGLFADLKNFYSERALAGVHRWTL